LKRSVTIPKLQYPFRIEGLQNISIGKNFSGGKNLRLQAISDYGGEKFAPSITIGNNVTVNPNCQIVAINNVTIGNNVLIASYVFISDHVHGELDYSDINIQPSNRKLCSKGPVIISDGVWIGQGVSILANIRIGKNVIIGANSVVTKDIPDNAIAAGIPAKIIKYT